MRKKKKIILAGLILFVFFLFVRIECHRSTYFLEKSFFSISAPKITESFRVVQLTDLHNIRFGEENEELISSVEEEEPDLILITGDLINSDEEDIQFSVHVMEQLVEIAPVYFSYGNHEKEYEECFHSNIKSMYKSAGATVLEYSYEDITVNGQDIRLGGIYGYCTPAKYLNTNEADPKECEFLQQFQLTDRYSILLCHMPFAWINNDGINEWDVDCVFSGHIHGGQIRLPFIGGLYAPDQGFFPGRVAGLYKSNDETKALVLSRGLGNTEKVPRFNNRPEIVVVDFLPQE